MGIGSYTEAAHTMATEKQRVTAIKNLTKGNKKAMASTRRKARAGEPTASERGEWPSKKTSTRSSSKKKGAKKKTATKKTTKKSTARKTSARQKSSKKTAAKKKSAKKTTRAKKRS